MYTIYADGTLQQIRNLTVKPLDSGQLDVRFTIEAAQLASADRKEELTKEKGTTLRLADEPAYEKVILGRNFFVPYEPPRPVIVRDETPPPKTPDFDHA